MCLLTKRYSRPAYIARQRIVQWSPDYRIFVQYILAAIVIDQYIIFSETFVRIAQITRLHDGRQIPTPHRNS